MSFASFQSIQSNYRYASICEELLCYQVCSTAPSSGVQTCGRKDSPATSESCCDGWDWIEIPSEVQVLHQVIVWGYLIVLVMSILFWLWVQSALRSPLIFMLNRSKRAVRKGSLLLPSSAQHCLPKEGRSVFHYSSAHFIGLLWGFQSCCASEGIIKILPFCTHNAELGSQVLLNSTPSPHTKGISG